MPITTVAIATAIGMGLGQVTAKVIDKGLVEPALKPAAEQLGKWVGKGAEKAKADRFLQKAVQAVFEQMGVPSDENAFRQYQIRLGFDRLQAKNSQALREAFARAALLQSTPDPAQIPEDLLRALNLPRDSQDQLAQFLYLLRQQLEKDEAWGELVQYSNERVIQSYLQQMSSSTFHIEQYLKLMLAAFGISDQSMEEALQSYLEHVANRYRAISFLFVKPISKGKQLTSSAELQAVFVPLQIQDPNAAPDEQAGSKGRREHELVRARLPEEVSKGRDVTIEQLLQQHPVFLLQGMPGCGKTTLLQHLAISFARGQAATTLSWTGSPLLPILLPLRNFGRFLENSRQKYTSTTSQPLLDFMQQYFKEQRLTLPTGFFTEWLDQGRCLCLLDGLDEVAERDLRVKVAQIVNKFIGDYQPKGNRFALASRPRGYEEVARHFNRVPVICQVQPMLPEGRNKLVGNLLGQFETDLPRWQAEKEKLVRQIGENRRIDELSRNPLFCTTLVLVYKYRGATLPARRVDVYHQLVELMLAFWDMHRVELEDVVAPEELALMDGTGRVFKDEEQAVEAKERALRHLAQWMQEQELAELPKQQAVEKLEAFFAEREGARAEQTKPWATGFLDIAHSRSGLFIEVDPHTHAFAHQNFREYLAATALINESDKLLEKVLGQAGNSWWEEVILLTVAHKALPDDLRQKLLGALLQGGHLLLAGRCAMDATSRLQVPMQNRVKEALYQRMVDGRVAPEERAAAGALLDGLGWLPGDLNGWVRCSACADNKQDLWVGKYPVTNAQFELFIEAGGYENPQYWGGQRGDGWKWRQAGKRYRSEAGIDEPEYWRDSRFGRGRRGYPVVGVSWYEATAYAAWLTELLQQAEGELKQGEGALVAALRAAGAKEVRLPSDREWVAVAGGAEAERYAWDKRGHRATQDPAQITQRANVSQSGIGQSSPVGMYPQGASEPFKLMDLCGNVWEWTSSWYDSDRDSCVVRGGSWYGSDGFARVAFRGWHDRHFSYNSIGFRVVSPTGSGS